VSCFLAAQWTETGEAEAAGDGEAPAPWKELIRTEFATRQIKRNAELLKRVNFPLTRSEVGGGVC
jgi:hypothetical protein